MIRLGAREERIYINGSEEEGVWGGYQHCGGYKSEYLAKGRANGAISVKISARIEETKNGIRLIPKKSIKTRVLFQSLSFDFRNCLKMDSTQETILRAKILNYKWHFTQMVDLTDFARALGVHPSLAWMNPDKIEPGWEVPSWLNYLKTDYDCRSYFTPAFINTTWNRKKRLVYIMTRGDRDLLATLVSQATPSLAEYFKDVYRASYLQDILPNDHPQRAPLNLFKTHILYERQVNEMTGREWRWQSIAMEAKNWREGTF